MTGEHFLDPSKIGVPSLESHVHLIARHQWWSTPMTGLLSLQRHWTCISLEVEDGKNELHKAEVSCLKCFNIFWIIWLLSWNLRIFNLRWLGIVKSCRPRKSSTPWRQTIERCGVESLPGAPNGWGVASKGNTSFLGKCETLTLKWSRRQLWIAFKNQRSTPFSMISWCGNIFQGRVDKNLIGVRKRFNLATFSGNRRHVMWSVY